MPKNVLNLCFGQKSYVDASVTWFEFLLCPIKTLMLKGFFFRTNLCNLRLIIGGNGGKWYQTVDLVLFSVGCRAEITERQLFHNYD